MTDYAHNYPTHVRNAWMVPLRRSLRSAWSAFCRLAKSVVAPAPLRDGQSRVVLSSLSAEERRRVRLQLQIMRTEQLRKEARIRKNNRLKWGK